VLGWQGKYEEAEAMHRRALKSREKALGPKHPDTLTSISNLSSVLQCQGKYEEAKAMHRPALESKEKGEVDDLLRGRGVVINAQGGKSGNAASGGEHDGTVQTLIKSKDFHQAGRNLLYLKPFPSLAQNSSNAFVQTHQYSAIH
jgi:tetratricopeptide (TPR) repeat protein